MQRAFRLIGLAAIYTAGFLVVELFGALHPYAWTYSAVPAALVCAWPYFKLCQRYPMPGVAMLSVVMLLLISFIIGQGHEFLVLGCFGFGMIADLTVAQTDGFGESGVKICGAIGQSIVHTGVFAHVGSRAGTIGGGHDAELVAGTQGASTIGGGAIVGGGGQLAGRDHGTGQTHSCDTRQGVGIAG